MQVLLVTLLVVLISAIIYGYFSKRVTYRRKGSATKPKHTGQRTHSGAKWRWRAVKVRPGLIACQKVQKIANIRYLCADAPELPLRECTQNQCVCKYIFLNDRREESGDRRGFFIQNGRFARSHFPNRRTGYGRRVSDVKP